MITSPSNDVSVTPEICFEMVREASERATMLPANTVQVEPGGAIFTSIQIAINSIQDASPGCLYQVSVGPGTYCEQVILKPFIFVGGPGYQATSIVLPENAANTGVVQTAGTGGIGQMAIVGGTTTTVKNACAIYIVSSSPDIFLANAVFCHATDNGIAGSIVITVGNDPVYGGSGTVVLINCTVTAQTEKYGSTTIAMQGTGLNFNYQVSGGGMSGNSSDSMGLMTNGQATAVLNNVLVGGHDWSLNNNDNQSPITANGCQLRGPVSAGVKVNP